MSGAVTRQVWAHADGAEGAELLVLLALADYADDAGWAWPSMASLAAKCRMSDRNARKIIRRLEEKGLVFVPSTKGGKGRSNRVRVLPEGAQTRNDSSAFGEGGKAERRNAGSGFKGGKAELWDRKGGTLVPPTHQEPSIEGGGRSAHARETAREMLPAILQAAGIDIDRDRNPARWFGSEPVTTVSAWIADLNLSTDDILETVKETRDGKRDGPPGSLRYFDRAMERRAGQNQRPALRPIAGGAARSPARERAEQRLDRDAEILAGLANRHR